MKWTTVEFTEPDYSMAMGSLPNYTSFLATLMPAATLWTTWEAWGNNGQESFFFSHSLKKKNFIY